MYVCVEGGRNAKWFDILPMSLLFFSCFLSVASELRMKEERKEGRTQASIEYTAYNAN